MLNTASSSGTAETWPAPWQRAKSIWPWLPAYTWQRLARRLPDLRPLHLIIGVANHFEPMNRTGMVRIPVDPREQERRVKAWCREYPRAVGRWRDQEGQPLRHTYFYPAEECDFSLVDRLVEHCHAGCGEVEIHLHHGVHAPDTAAHTRDTLVEFRDALAARGCLAREDGSGPPRYGFVHGNWALANSDRGRYCGVDEEMQILADTGCYADFTLPAPSPAQVAKINALYECSLPLRRRAPHRRGTDLEKGRSPRSFPLIVQGPLMLDLARRRRGRLAPGIESGELTATNPPTMRRLRLWQEAAITVRGRPDWLFIKLHCHGLTTGDESALYGPAVQNFLDELVEGSKDGTQYQLHFVTLREMVNIALAACEGRDASPGNWRDYRFQRLESACRA